MGIDKKMAERFAKIRLEKGITQAEFAKILEIGRSTVTNLEKGNTPLTERNIKMTCFSFNVNETWLRTGIGEMFIRTPEGPNSDAERKLVDMFRRLIPELQEIVLQKVREMLGLTAETWTPAEKSEKRAVGE